MATALVPTHASAGALRADGDPSRITNGDLAETCQFPSAAALVGEDGDPFCTGTLVHPQLLITAAHCILSQTPTHIAFGEDAYNPAFTVTADLCVMSPDYVANESESTDLAVCQLTEPVNDVPLVPVLMGCETDVLQRGAALTIVGFGNTITSPTKGGVGSGPKRFVEQFVYEIRPDDGEIDIVGETFVEGGCHGDSGGPAFVQLADGSWRVFGTAQSIFRPPEAKKAAMDDNFCGGGTTYTLITPEMEWVESLTATDLTPCFDTAGEWDPTETCTPFPSDIEQSVGDWSRGCGGGYGGEPQCGELPEPPGTTMAPADTGESSGDGSSSSTSTSTSGPPPPPPPASTTEPEATGTGGETSGAAATDEDKGCGCRTPATAGGSALWLLLLGFARRRATARALRPERRRRPVSYL